MERNRKIKILCCKKPIKVWDVNADNIVISKLIETKTNSKCLIEIEFDKTIRPLVLIMPKMSGYVQTFKVKEEDNKLISIDDVNLFELFLLIFYLYMTRDIICKHI